MNSHLSGAKIFHRTHPGSKTEPSGGRHMDDSGKAFNAELFLKNNDDCGYITE